jgi:hypothetical protein
VKYTVSCDSARAFERLSQRGLNSYSLVVNRQRLTRLLPNWAADERFPKSSGTCSRRVGGPGISQCKEANEPSSANHGSATSILGGSLRVRRYRQNIVTLLVLSRHFLGSHEFVFRVSRAKRV